ncbi:hypothetical protein CV102_17585 [Natronococcus pandeyae]|uniref:Uncharacterized protein n=1 Tax=Natronococcus pandeyae TaxID=2055836 RepID=A0A8J8PYX8_9EURY|nr:hypothetical protein [Natronococcus pandeyae]TYL37421.1 hypothetical protein CV102_17585 [Natronococcus pandeyae]
MTDACQTGELVLEMAEAKSMPEPLTEEYSDRVQMAVAVYESLEFTADHTKAAGVFDIDPDILDKAASDYEWYRFREYHC